MFQWINQDKPAPEALELESKQQQLEVLEERYAEVQTDYVSLQNALAAFKQRYWQRVGHLYARLDEVRAESARYRAQLTPLDVACQSAFKAASQQAKSSADAARDVNVDMNLPVFEPTEELRKFYRMAAKIVHPDRAGDDQDRNLRDEIMSRINVAYRDGHVLTIQALIDEYQMRIQPGEEDDATRLIRTIRLLSRLREQIAEISQATVGLRESGLYRLYRAVDEAESKGIDKLRVIEIGIERDIERAQLELQRLTSQWAEQQAAAQRLAMALLEKASAPEDVGPQGSGEAAEALAEQALVEVPDAEDVEVAEVLEPDPSLPLASELLAAMSPGEKQIAVLLHAQGIGFAYRQALGEGREHVPAFTIATPEGASILWQHLERAGEGAGFAQWLPDLVWYAANGYDAGVNLFVTRDAADGGPDLARLGKVLGCICVMLGIPVPA